MPVARRCAHEKICVPLNMTPGTATSASRNIRLELAAEDEENMSFSNRRPKNTFASALTLRVATPATRRSITVSQLHGIEDGFRRVIHAFVHGQLHEHVLERLIVLQPPQPIDAVVRHDLAVREDHDV